MQKLLLLTICCTFISLVSFSQPVIIGDFTEDALNSIHQSESTIRATTERSDTIDLLHFNLFLSVGDGTDQTISGYSIIEFKSKMNDVNQIYLDLLKLNVDSVIQENQSLTFD